MGRYDIFHLHWPEYYLNAPRWKAIIGIPGVLFFVTWLRLRGARVVWTIHNLHSHTRRYPRVERWFWRILTPLLDGYIGLSDSTVRQACELYPALQSIPGSVIPHGHYQGIYQSEISRAGARQKLGISMDSTVLLFFGGIVPYKNVPRLIQTFRDSSLESTILVVAGLAPDPGDKLQVTEAARGDKRIQLHLRWIRAEEVQVFFAAADLVVCPFSEITNSGSVVLALSFGKPVVVPSLGALSELQQQVGSDWVRTYQGNFTCDKLASGVAWAKETARGLRPDLAGLEWRNIAYNTVAFFSRLLPGRLASTRIEPAVHKEG